MIKYFVPKSLVILNVNSTHNNVLESRMFETYRKFVELVFFHGWFSNFWLNCGVSLDVRQFQDGRIQSEKDDLENVT